MGRKTRGVELVVGVRLESRRDDEPERVEGREADDDQEGVAPHQPHETTAGAGSHAATALRRTHRESPISTLAIPSSITATLAAVPFAPFEKLRQM